MRKYFFILIYMALVAVCDGQTKFEPQILITAPCTVKYDPVFESDITAANLELKSNSKIVNAANGVSDSMLKGLPENWKICKKYEMEFLKKADFFKTASFISEQYLAYRLFESFPNLMIKLKDVKCDGGHNELKKLAEQEQVQYVLNFTSIELYKQNNISYAKVDIQLYDRVTDSLMLQQTYTGDWHNPGFEFCCEEKTIHCTIHNALSQALDDILKIVFTNSPTMQRADKLRQERFNALWENYAEKPFDKKFLNGIIPPTDTNINTGMAYQALFNSDRSKFVAFFLEAGDKQSFKQMNDNKKDRNVKKIIYKNIKDQSSLNDLPATYAYIVKGIQYNGKWYYEKAEVTYFRPSDDAGGKKEHFNNLQDWNFFKDNSTEPNPDFWETYLFKKVPDLKKDPDWKKYGEGMWKYREEENRPYIGLYEIVADKMREEKGSR